MLQKINSKRYLLSIIAVFLVSTTHLWSQPTELTEELNQPIFKGVEAAKMGDLERLRQIIIAYPHLVTTLDTWGRGMLQTAATHGRLEVVKFLLENGVNDDQKVKQEALRDAATKGNQDIVELLIKHGAKIDPVDEYGYTPLNWAIDGGHLTTVKYLVEHGANIEENSSGALAMAKRLGHKEIVDFLQPLHELGTLYQ